MHTHYMHVVIVTFFLPFITFLITRLQLSLSHLEKWKTLKDMEKTYSSCCQPVDLQNRLNWWRKRWTRKGGKVVGVILTWKTYITWHVEWWRRERKSWRRKWMFKRRRMRNMFTQTPIWKVIKELCTCTGR